MANESLKDVFYGVILFSIIFTGCFVFWSGLFDKYGIIASENEKRLFNIDVKEDIINVAGNQSEKLAESGINTEVQSIELGTNAYSSLLLLMSLPGTIYKVVDSAIISAGLPSWISPLFWLLIFVSPMMPK